MSVAQIVFDQKTLNTKKIVDEVRDRTHNTLFSSQLKNGHGRLEGYVTLEWNSLSRRNTSLLGKFVSYKENKLL
jgi:hypothetical protein